MNNNWEALFFLLMFVVVPILRWLFERKEAAKKRSAMPKELRREIPAGDERLEDDEEDLPAWFDEDQWEVIDEEPGPPPPPPRRPAPPAPVVFTVGSEGPRQVDDRPAPRRQLFEDEIQARRALRAQQRAAEGPPPRSAWEALTREPELRKAIIFAELFGPPRALRPHGEDR